MIEILILKALAKYGMGEIAQAEIALAECLHLAEPEGYRRIFLDEGQPMQRMLVQWLAHADHSPSRDYVAHLLSQFNARPHKSVVTPEKVSTSGYLVEQLSPRELEVLHLISLGETNQEIAQQLIVSPGTVKAHTANIYSKLDVANRTEAVARARQLGILP
jgi:LuxR family maltose regulon positive regulatory protein